MIYVTGDMHGDISRFSKRAIKKLKANDTLIILGDFGFLWNGDGEEQKNLEFIKGRRFNVLFIDGAHENFMLLNSFPVIEYCGGKARDLGGNLKQLMRGEIYTIEDKKIFCMGGGQSDDAEFRVENESWWQEELPSCEEIAEAKERLSNNKDIDFILTHEAPQKIRTSLIGDKEEGNRLCKFFDEIMYSVKYKNWYFGRYHIDRRLTRTHYAVYNRVIEITSPEKKSFFAKLLKRKR